MSESFFQRHTTEDVEVRRVDICCAVNMIVSALCVSSFLARCCKNIVLSNGPLMELSWVGLDGGVGGTLCGPFCLSDWWRWWEMSQSPHGHGQFTLNLWVYRARPSYHNSMIERLTEDKRWLRGWKTVLDQICTVIPQPQAKIRDSWAWP